MKRVNNKKRSRIRAYVPVQELKRMLASNNARERLRGLKAMRQQLVAGRPKVYFTLARKLLADPNNNCRWQAAIVVGEFIEHRPDDVWNVVVQHASTRSNDMKDALATVLLEHLLEKDFDRYFGLVKQHCGLHQDGMRDILSRCWPFGEATHKWSEVPIFLAGN